MVTVYLFFKPRHEVKISMKSDSRRKDAIKNSADEDPEGYSTILDAPMCNGGLVSPTKLFMSGSYTMSVTFIQFLEDAHVSGNIMSSAAIM